MKIEGGCFCGEIRYEIAGALKDVRCCHCSRCRKVFSGASSAYAEVGNGEFSWLRGRENLSVHPTQEGWAIGFCRSCGSTLCGLHEGEVDGVTLGSLDGDPPVAIEMHIFVGSKASWDKIGGDAPQYEERPE